jgi:hypothetical protein
MREGERREKKSSYEQCINSECVREAEAGGNFTKRGRRYIVHGSTHICSKVFETERVSY